MTNLTEQITIVNQSLAGVGFHPDYPNNLNTLKPRFSTLANFLKIKQEAALILAVAISESEKNSVRVSDVQEFMGLSEEDLNLIHPALMCLANKGLIEIQERKPTEDINSALTISSSTTFIILPNVLEAIKTGNRRLLKSPKISTLGQLLGYYNDYYQSRKKRFIEFSTFISRLEKLCKGQQLEVIKYLNQLKVKGVELALILHIIRDFVLGDVSSEGDHFLNDLLGDESDLLIEWRARFRQRQGLLIKEGLLEINSDFEGFQLIGRHYDLGDKIIARLPFYKVQSRRFSSNLMRVTYPDKIREVSLQFTDSLQRQIDVLRKAMEPGQFKKLQQRLQEKSMKQGLTIMLHGASGTGKTETAYQLARETGRVILEADASEIKGAFVGESEKAMRRLFRDYKAAKKAVEEVPILFFNEADALIQARRKVERAIDAHDNALQNILLQELEEFDGIFIATTNLVGNMDAAFDRRFLYKLEYGQPDVDIRLQILTKKFDRVDPAWLGRIAAQYHITGGQIENVCRKLEIESALDENFVLNLEKLESLFDQESMRGSREHLSVEIGFKGNWKENF